MTQQSAKTNDEVRLVDFDEDLLFDDDVRATTRGTTASTKKSATELEWLTKVRTRVEKLTHDTTRFSDSDD